MSRTYKDIKRVKLKKFYTERWDTLYDRCEYKTTYSGWAGYRIDTDKLYTRTFYIRKAGVSPKLRKLKDTEDHWMTTPGWWISLTMTKPQRRAGTMWERGVVKSRVIELEEVDVPNVGRKPHIYYY